jgi:hypothetical protein
MEARERFRIFSRYFFIIALLICSSVAVYTIYYTYAYRGGEGDSFLAAVFFSSSSLAYMAYLGLGITKRV